MRDAKAFRQTNGCTTLPLELDRFGSCFIVFRKPIAKTVAGKAEQNFPKLDEIQELSGSWNVKFDPTWGGPANAEFPELISWTQRPEEGIKFYSGKATYRKTFNLEFTPKSPKGGFRKALEDNNITLGVGGENSALGNNQQKLFLDLGDVRNIAEVWLNGKSLGILWCYPWRLEITVAVMPANNVLEIDVINLWTNRVVGDLNQPKEKRLTKTHDVFRFDMTTGKTPLLDSGLLGPVRILTTEM